MEQLPKLETERLILRPPELADAPTMRALADDFDIARNLLAMPHPYTDADARQFIEQRRAEMEHDDTGCAFAIIRRTDQQFMGMIGFGINAEHRRAELGYWLGKPYWGQGYATEAARATLRYCFDQLELNKVCAGHFAHNPASGRVLQKLGMSYEGTLRKHFARFGEFHDTTYYSMLRSDWRE